MKSNENLVAFQAKFRQKELHVVDAGAWILSVRPGQLTLGAMVLSSRSGAASMADLTPEEMQGMGAGFVLAERLASQVFGADRINYLCLMMQDPVVHFHIFPRYSGPLLRYGRSWEDPDWPGPPQVKAVVTEDAVLLEIRDALRSALEEE